MPRTRKLASLSEAFPSVQALTATLKGEGTLVRAEREKAYLKSDLKFLGVSVPQVRAHAKALHKQTPHADRETVLSFAEAMWATRIHELRSLAINVLALKVQVLRPEDLKIIETMLRSARTWAHVDELATQVVAPLCDARPAGLRIVARWQRDEDFWMRRTALLALLPALRKGGGDFALFEKWAAPLLEEKEFFIRKAIGWVLREVSKKRPKLVFVFLQKHRERVSGLTMREGKKYLPAEWQAKLVA
ncbi:MAG: DNA alkylation repair protein [Deltaproteobacteria bacterium]|nr:DNA alkylation repair protein [Deltaproteobacteria bacterium]